MTGQEALRELLEGNERFAECRPAAWEHDEQVRRGLIAHVAPIAAVLCCSDGRTAPEIVFDQPLGRMFVTRVPGNIVTSETLAALEFAVCQLGAPLLLVLGHSHCAAVEAAASNSAAVGPLGPVVLRLYSAVQRAQSHPTPDLLTAAIYENVQMSLEAIRIQSLDLRSRIQGGQALLVGAVYDMVSGRVDPKFLPDR
jgi:carbonic anhydrase